MTYYFSKTLTNDFDQARQLVTAALQKEGFGILSEIAIHEKLREKLGIDFPRYIILGACNPAYAYKALQAENKIGTMLPCNMIIRETGDQEVEIAAVNPIESMKAVKNPALESVALEVTEMLKRVIASL